MVSLEVIFKDGSMNTFCYIRNFTKDTKQLIMSFGNYDIVIDTDKIDEVRKLDFAGPGHNFWMTEVQPPACVYNGSFPFCSD